jgi:hypothetical protein
VHGKTSEERGDDEEPQQADAEMTHGSYLAEGSNRESHRIGGRTAAHARDARPKVYGERSLALQGGRTACPVGRGFARLSGAC